MSRFKKEQIWHIKLQHVGGISLPVYAKTSNDRGHQSQEPALQHPQRPGALK